MISSLVKGISSSERKTSQIPISRRAMTACPCCLSSTFSDEWSEACVDCRQIVHLKIGWSPSDSKIYLENALPLKRSAYYQTPILRALRK